MSHATDKISLSPIDCQDHVECWEEYHESGMVLRFILSETDVEEYIKVLQETLITMIEIREEKGYLK